MSDKPFSPDPQPSIGSALPEVENRKQPLSPALQEPSLRQQAYILACLAFTAFFFIFLYGALTREISDYGRLVVILSFLGVGAYFTGKNGFGPYQPVQVPLAPMVVAEVHSHTRASNLDIDLLTELASLHARGILSDAEFQNKKADILQRL